MATPHVFVEPADCADGRVVLRDDVADERGEHFFEETHDELALAEAVAAEERRDALEEAGCNSQEMLDHCRNPGEHVRGCWVVDLALAKE